jgi:hypothetical protein
VLRKAVLGAKPGSVVRITLRSKATTKSEGRMRATAKRRKNAAPQRPKKAHLKKVRA